MSNRIAATISEDGLRFVARSLATLDLAAAELVEENFPAVSERIAEAVDEIRENVNLSEENAALFANAPELLRELKELTAVFWEGRPKCKVNRDFYLMNRHAAALKAIWKAEGCPTTNNEEAAA